MRTVDENGFLVDEEDEDYSDCEYYELTEEEANKLDCELDGDYSMIRNGAFVCPVCHSQLIKVLKTKKNKIKYECFDCGLCFDVYSMEEEDDV